MSKYLDITIHTNFKNLKAQKFFDLLDEYETNYINEWCYADISLRNGVLSILLEVDHDEEHDDSEVPPEWIENFKKELLEFLVEYDLVKIKK